MRKLLVGGEGLRDVPVGEIRCSGRPNTRVGVQMRRVPPGVWRMEGNDEHAICYGNGDCDCSTVEVIMARTGRRVSALV